MIKMDELRALYESLGLEKPRTYIQSGNVVFLSGERNLAQLAGKIEKAIEEKFGFRTEVVLRTASELRDTLAANPFAGRPGLEPAKLLVTFLRDDPGEEMRTQINAMKADPEEIRAQGREIYIYFPDGMGRTKLQLKGFGKGAENPGTGRNLNTVRKLLEIADALEASQ